VTSPLPIKVTRRAAREIARACEWWDANRPAAPGAVREEIVRLFGLIAHQPGVGARAVNPKLPGVQRVHLSRVRYHLYYRYTTASGPTLQLSRFSRSGTPAVAAARACDSGYAEPAVGADAWEAARLTGRPLDIAARRRKCARGSPVLTRKRDELTESDPAPARWWRTGQGLPGRRGAGLPVHDGRGGMMKSP